MLSMSSIVRAFSIAELEVSPMMLLMSVCVNEIMG